MGQNLRGKTYGNTIGTLCQEQRELNRERYRLLLTTIVGQHPLRSLLVIYHIEGKFRQASLDISCCRSLITRKDITPVTLHIDKQTLLTKLHQGILDRGITVGVILHSLTHDICHLVVATILNTLHSVQDTALHGFQTILQMGHGTLEDNIRGIVQEPVLIHTRKTAHTILCRG